MLVRHFVESTARDRRPSCSSAGAGRGLGPPWRRLALVEESGPRTVGGVLALTRLSREKGPQPSSARIIRAAAAQACIIGAHVHTPVDSGAAATARDAALQRHREPVRSDLVVVVVVVVAVGY